MGDVTAIVQAFLALGPTVILPVFIFIIGLGFGTGAGTAFRSGLTIGVGFVGINLVVSFKVLNSWQNKLTHAIVCVKLIKHNSSITR